MNIIRKLSVGSDYKNAMHYIVGQPVLRGSSSIYEIMKSDKEKQYHIYIKTNVEITRWKGFNFNMPLSIEYDINF